METEDEKITKKGKVKQVTNETLATIADDYDNVLVLLQAIAVKSPQVIAAPIYLLADKRARVWLRRWTDTTLPTPPRPAP